jgi:hypothetical protein
LLSLVGQSASIFEIGPEDEPTPRLAEVAAPSCDAADGDRRRPRPGETVYAAAEHQFSCFPATMLEVTLLTGGAVTKLMSMALVSTAQLLPADAPPYSPSSSSSISANATGPPSGASVICVNSWRSARLLVEPFKGNQPRND